MQGYIEKGNLGVRGLTVPVTLQLFSSVYRCSMTIAIVTTTLIMIDISICGSDSRNWRLGIVSSSSVLECRK